MMHLVTLLLVSSLSAQADIGPKPSAFFAWKSHQGIDLPSVKLLQCKDAFCKEASPLQPLGPQHFTCCEAGCFAMAYGFSDQSQLTALVDGKQVWSAPFAIAKPDGFFEVEASKGKLLVRAVKSLPEEKKNSIQYCK